MNITRHGMKLVNKQPQFNSETSTRAFATTLIIRLHIYDLHPQYHLYHRSHRLHTHIRTRQNLILHTPLLLHLRNPPLGNLAVC